MYPNESLVPFVNKIQEDMKPETIVIAGKTYSTKELKLITNPLPSDLHVYSLNSLIDYVKMNVDKLELKGCIIIISGFDDVSIYGCLDEYQARPHFLHSKVDVYHRFNEYLPAEDMIIYLQSAFEQSDILVKMLGVCSGSKDLRETELKDNGVSQEVKVKAGIVLAEVETIPNPVLIKPYMTFPEMDQPELRFVFRAKILNNQIHYALFKVSNNFWEYELIAKMKDYLKDKLSGIDIAII
jgi:hypothetical protein